MVFSAPASLSAEIIPEKKFPKKSKKNRKKRKKGVKIYNGVFRVQKSVGNFTTTVRLTLTPSSHAAHTKLTPSSHQAENHSAKMNTFIDLTVVPPHITQVHSCSICLELMMTPYWLGCHVFCKGCISDWVLTSTTCPTCRVKLPDALLDELRLPRRSGRKSKSTVMYTYDGYASSTVTSREMMERVENIDRYDDK